MFIAIPVGMNYRTERLPLVTLSLIGVNTLVWLVTLIVSFRTNGESGFHLLDNRTYLFLFGIWMGRQQP
jgi:hypothetical protein